MARKRSKLVWVIPVVAAVAIAIVVLALAPFGRSTDPRLAAAELALERYLRSDDFGRTVYLTPKSTVDRNVRYPLALYLSAQDSGAATSGKTSQQNVSVNVIFLGPPFTQRFDMQKTSDGLWLVNGQSGG